MNVINNNALLFKKMQFKTIEQYASKSIVNKSQLHFQGLNHSVLQIDSDEISKDSNGKEN